MWSLTNFGLNLLFIRLCDPVQYGTFAFWANIGYVLVSVMNAVSVSHLFVEAPGDILQAPRLQVERLMHLATGVFLFATAIVSMAIHATLDPHVSLPGLLAPVVYLLAFLLQNYVRSLAFSRGRIKTAAIQTGLSLGVCVLCIALVSRTRNLSASEVLYILGGSYGATGLIALIIATWGQFRNWQGTRFGDFLPFIRDSGWIFVGVTATEVLARFYAFATTARIGPAALASLTATQQLLRPLPLLAGSLVSAERAELARKRDAGDLAGLVKITVTLSMIGLVVSLVWTGIVALAWPYLTRSLFAGKYGDDAWMITLWGVACAISFCQFVVSASIQSLKAFKALAVANLSAALVAAAAIVVLIHGYGVVGAILGTIIGQALELTVMVWLLRRCVLRMSMDTPVNSMRKP